MAKTYRPTAAIAKRAALGLKLRSKFGRGGTSVGLARGKQLASRSPVTVEDARDMYMYFARHEVDSQAKGSTSRGFWGDLENPSAGWIAWLLWGDNVGRKWATIIWEKEKERRN